MKKFKNKGFMLAETLIVASFISVTLVYLFVQIRNISNNYSTTMNYNSVNGMYINNEIKKFISQYDMEQITLQMAYSDMGYFDLTECNVNIFTDTDYCNEFFSRLNIKKSIFTLEKNNITDDTISNNFMKYLNSISVSDSNMYIIATEFNDGTFASIRLSGYQFPTLEDRIKQQEIAIQYSGLYNLSSADGERYVFKGNTNEVDNYINIYGYNGRIIEVNNQGVKIAIENNGTLKFNDRTSFYTNNNMLIFGQYIEKSDSNSSLFSSLNAICQDCDKIVKDAKWSVGAIDTVVGNSLNSIIQSENATIYQGVSSYGYVGTVSVSDIITASTSTSCNHSNISNNCLSNNWLNANVWMINSKTNNTAWVIKNNAFTSETVTNFNKAYAVIYINKDAKASGDGTIDNPYTIF